MLKFFRKYNKWLLAVGGSILMVAFLLPTMQGGMGPSGPQDFPIGTLDGEEVMNSRQQLARQDMMLLQMVSNGFLPVPAMEDNRNEPDAVAWMLILHDATENMGLYAGDQQVLELRAMVTEMNQIDEEQLRVALARQGYRLSDLDEALRNWLIYQRYQELVLGLGNVPLTDKLGQYGMVNMLMQYGAWDYAMRAAMGAQGRARMSRPLLEHVINEQNAAVQLEVVRVDAGNYLDKTPTPSEADVQALFDKHKEKFEGEGEEYGFGYRLPDRVKIEYLTVTIEQLREAVKRQRKVKPEHTLAFYERNQGQFVELPEQPEVGPDGEQPPPANPRQKSYLEVQGEIEKVLIEQEAEKLGDEVLKSALLMLNDDARTLRTGDDGYKLIDKFNPMSLSDVADRLEKQYGVRPQIVRRDDQWYDAKALASLPDGIDDSVLPTQGRMPIPFVNYVMSTHEIAGDDAQSALAMLRLQAKLPSQPLVNSATGNRFLFRIIEAEKNRAPASLDEVRDNVARDAHRLAAYQKMLADRDQFVDALRLQPMTQLVETYGEGFCPTPFTKRQTSAFGPVVPEVPPIGRSEKFVDGVFAIVSNIMDAGGLGSATPEQAEGVIALDDQQALLLVRVVEIKAMTRSRFDQIVNDQNGAAAAVLQAVGSDLDEPAVNPFSRKALMERTGYKPLHDEETAEGETAEVTTESSDL